MVFSYYLLNAPYSFIWHIVRLLGLLKPLVFYCGDPIDYQVFRSISQHFENIMFVTDKPKVRAYLEKKGIVCSSLPVFPQTVLMARHATHKFPCSKIVRIGMRHGAYHFKRMTTAESYNKFDLYLLTSRSDLITAREIGVTSAQAIGFPKLDPAFNGAISYESIKHLKSKINLDEKKPTVLFSATYDSSGMSAISVWYNHLGKLTDNWNVLVTLHPWIKLSYKDKIRSTPNVHLIEDYDTLPYIMLADITVGDNSSILAEFCALDKPILTFYLNHAKRSLDEITDLIDAISYKVKGFADLEQKLVYALEHKNELQPLRTVANAIFFDSLDGQASLRAANAIKQAIAARR